MRVILLRHGQSKGNLKRISQGWKDWGLSKLGIEQARKAAECLKKEGITKIFSSDLGRAKMTSEEIIKILGKELIIDKRLREQCKGMHEGKAYNLIEERRRKLNTNKFDFTPKGGETWDKVKKRVDEFFKEIVGQGGTPLLVAHGGTFRSLLSSLFNEDIRKSDKYKHSNAGITFIDKTADGWKITKLNDTQYLK